MVRIARHHEGDEGLAAGRRQRGEARSIRVIPPILLPPVAMSGAAAGRIKGRRWVFRASVTVALCREVGMGYRLEGDLSRSATATCSARAGSARTRRGTCATGAGLRDHARGHRRGRRGRAGGRGLVTDSGQRPGGQRPRQLYVDARGRRRAGGGAGRGDAGAQGRAARRPRGADRREHGRGAGADRL